EDDRICSGSQRVGHAESAIRHGPKVLRLYPPDIAEPDTVHPIGESSSPVQVAPAVDCNVTAGRRKAWGELRHRGLKPPEDVRSPIHTFRTNERDFHDKDALSTNVP